MKRPVPVFPAFGARFLRGAAALSAAAVLAAACATTGSGQSVGAATSSASASGAASAMPSFSMPVATGVATSLDPCQVVTQQDAAQLAGAPLTAGKEETTSGHGRICTYGAGTTNVFTVIVGQAPDVATAQAEEAAAEQAIKRQTQGLPIKITQLTGIGDAAVFMTFSQSLGGKTLSGSSIYALKGTVFFGFSDLILGGAAPSQAAMTAEAQNVVNKLP